MLTLPVMDKSVIAKSTASMLLEIEAVHVNAREPFILTSGAASPVYIDCRKLISFPRIRSALMGFAASVLAQDAGFEAFDSVAGGETAGIPFAAFLAERLALPMQYVRKKPKGFGRNAQIEGELVDGTNVLLVEDLATDGGSKLLFANALRQAGVSCDHAFVVFYYNIFDHAQAQLDEAGLTLHYLSSWWDVLAEIKTSDKFDSFTAQTVESFLHDPKGWSKANGGQQA
ncbi:orotate phosphoribosyltransferase [SAR116 cluster alpha proteobacterium HIMB100]|nr:orotate phosphoribosyltransferase [SAR116 cluster alpha proteobacterium HIMB100]